MQDKTEIMSSIWDYYKKVKELKALGTHIMSIASSDDWDNLWVLNAINDIDTEIGIQFDITEDKVGT